MKESPALDRYLVRSNDSIFNFFNDKLSRQTEAHWSGSGSGRYNSRFFSYDLNGNICKLDPWVAGTPFLETQYNFMNMPEYRRLSSAEEWTVYDANGEKQAVYSYDSSNSTTRKLEYACNLIFYNGSPNWLLTDGGHIELGGDTPVYQWWLTDHLGNVRVVADSLGTISQTNHFDPYGGTIGVNTVRNTIEGTYYATENLFKFGGKEWNKTFSDYDFSARYFSTDYARFTTQDPLAENTPNLSPYAYCAGNPMRFVDPTGMWHWEENNNNLYWDKGDNAETLANFLEIDQNFADQIYKRGASRRMKEGSYISSEKLWYEVKDRNSPRVWNTQVAVLHYYFGKGEPADIGWDSNGQIFSSPEIKDILNDVRAGKVPKSTYIELNMTFKTFHIGKTRIDFEIKHGDNANSINFTTLVGDGFWDPNFIAERIGKNLFKLSADGKGKRYELGGVPYNYIPRERTYFFKPF